jgi:hypothetical protein
VIVFAKADDFNHLGSHSSLMMMAFVFNQIKVSIMSSNKLEMTDAAELTVEEINEVSGGWSWNNAFGLGITGALVASETGPIGSAIGYTAGFVIGGLSG